MGEYLEKTLLPDNGGRRSETDRRQFSYTSYIPERRTGGEDRRVGKDRRKQPRLFAELDKTN